MRSTFYTSDPTTYAQVAAIAQNGWLIVVQEESVEGVRALVRVFGGRCLTDIVGADPNVNAAWARDNSVEVRTLAEMEQMEFNEKLAMEVL